MQTKLSRHQRTILRILAEEIEVKDEFWGIPVSTLSWMAARKLERKPGDYINKNMKEWRRRKREEEFGRFRRGKSDRVSLALVLYFLRDSPQKRDETLTEKWRATFSRCLRRLERRGLIKRINSIYYEIDMKGVYHWDTYNGERAHLRTLKVILEPKGRALAESL